MSYKPMHEIIKPIHTGIRPEHLEGNNGYGRIIFAPGSYGRAVKIGDNFNRTKIIKEENRKFITFIGEVEIDGIKYDAAALNTGMGCPSADIVLTELFSASYERMKRNPKSGLYVLRVGTCGWYGDKKDRKGAVAIVDSAVTDDETVYTYIPKGYPLRAHRDWLKALDKAKDNVNFDVLKGKTYTKASLNIELFTNPKELGLSNPYLAARIKNAFETMSVKDVHTSSMEEAVLFGFMEAMALSTGLGDEIGWDKILGPKGNDGLPAFGWAPNDENYWKGVRYKAGSVQAIVGDQVAPFYKNSIDRELSEEHAIELALKGGAQFYKMLKEAELNCASI